MNIASTTVLHSLLSSLRNCFLVLSYSSYTAFLRFKISSYENYIWLGCSLTKQHLESLALLTDFTRISKDYKKIFHSLKGFSLKRCLHLGKIIPSHIGWLTFSKSSDDLLLATREISQSSVIGRLSQLALKSWMS